MTRDRTRTPLRTDAAVRDAVASALSCEAAQPLIESTSLLVAACVRAAQLYPEWAAGVIDATKSPELDRIVQRLVAHNLGAIA